MSKARRNRRNSTSICIALNAATPRNCIAKNGERYWKAEKGLRRYLRSVPKGVELEFWYEDKTDLVQNTTVSFDRIAIEACSGAIFIDGKEARLASQLGGATLLERRVLSYTRGSINNPLLIEAYDFNGLLVNVRSQAGLGDNYIYSCRNSFDDLRHIIRVF